MMIIFFFTSFLFLSENRIDLLKISENQIEDLLKNIRKSNRRFI